MTPLLDELHNRLVLTKYLLSRANEQTGRTEPYSAGLAISSIQDGIELFLRAVAEHLHATIKEQETFNSIMDKIDEAAVSLGKSRLTHRTALIQVNKLRVSFKHFGLDPKMTDVQRLHRETETFFSVAVREYFSVDAGSISLIGLIGHRRTENWMNKAQTFLDAGEYTNAIASAATGFGVYRDYWGSGVGRHRLLGPGNFTRDRDIQRVIEAVEQRFRKLEELFDLTIAGINLADYHRFVNIAPLVQFTGTKALVYWQRTPNSDAAEAVFCFRFVLDSILQMKRMEFQPGEGLRGNARTVGGRVRIVKECDVLVGPDERSEVLKKAIAGELFEITGQGPWQGYLPIIFDDETAWVSEQFVENVPPEVTT